MKFLMIFLIRIGVKESGSRIFATWKVLGLILLLWFVPVIASLLLILLNICLVKGAICHLSTWSICISVWRKNIRWNFISVCMIPGSIGIRVIYLGRLKIINTLLMKSGNNTVKNTRVLADGISVARSAVRLKGLLMLSGQWENNARMSLEVFLLLFLLGLTEKRLWWGLIS